MAAQQASNTLISLSEEVNTCLKSPTYADVHWALQLHITRLLHDALAFRERCETATLRAASLEHERAQLDSKCLLEAEKGRQLAQQLSASRTETRELQRQLQQQQRRAAADVKALEGLQAQSEMEAAAAIQTEQNAHKVTQKALEATEHKIQELRQEITAQTIAHNAHITRVNQAKNAEIAALLSQVSELRQERDLALEAKIQAENDKSNALKQQNLLQNLYENLKQQHAKAKKTLFKKKQQEDAMRLKNERTKKDLEVLQAKMNEGIGIPTDLVRTRQSPSGLESGGNGANSPVKGLRGQSSQSSMSPIKQAGSTLRQTNSGSPTRQPNAGAVGGQKQPTMPSKQSSSSAVTTQNKTSKPSAPAQMIQVNAAQSKSQQNPKVTDIKVLKGNAGAFDSICSSMNSTFAHSENSEASEASENSVEDISAKIYEMNEQRERLTKLALQQMLEKQKALEERLFAEAVRASQFKEANADLQKQMRQFMANHVSDQEKIKELVNLLKFTDKELNRVKNISENYDKLDMANRILQLEEENRQLKQEMDRRQPSQSGAIGTPRQRSPGRSPKRSHSSRSSTPRDGNRTTPKLRNEPFQSKPKSQNEKQSDRDGKSEDYNYVQLQIASPATVVGQTHQKNTNKDTDLSATQLKVTASQTRLMQHFQQNKEISKQQAAKRNLELLRSRIDEQEEKIKLQEREILNLKNIIKNKNEVIESMQWPHQNRYTEQQNAMKSLL